MWTKFTLLSRCERIAATPEIHSERLQLAAKLHAP